MALGFDTGHSAPYLPIVKFDARSHRLIRIDPLESRRVFVDITDQFSALVDMERLEAGWMLFGRGAPPDMRMFPIGAPWTPAPSPLHRKGIRVILHLSPECGGDTRELCTTAGTFLRAFDRVHDRWLAERSSHRGKLPVMAAVQPDAAAGTAFDLAITGWNKPPAQPAEAA